MKQNLNLYVDLNCMKHLIRIEITLRPIQSNMHVSLECLDHNSFVWTTFINLRTDENDLIFLCDGLVFFFHFFYPTHFFMLTANYHYTCRKTVYIDFSEYSYRLPKRIGIFSNDKEEVETFFILCSFQSQQGNHGKNSCHHVFCRFEIDLS